MTHITCYDVSGVFSWGCLWNLHFLYVFSFMSFEFVRLEEILQFEML